MHDEFERRTLEALNRESSLFDEFRTSELAGDVFDVPESFFEEFEAALERQSRAETASAWRTRG